MNFSPESAPQQKRPEPEAYPHLDTVIKLAESRVFSHAIDPNDFIRSEEDPNSGPYDRASVERDVAYLARTEQQIVESNWSEDFKGNRSRIAAMQKIAHAFEGVMLQADSNEWLGPGVEIIIPSRYDDVVNGIDGIAEFHDEGYFSHLALGMDVTSSERIEKKLARVKSEIEKGELAKIRYFESESMHFKGEKKNIPRVIVGADRQTVYDLTLLWSEGKMAELSQHHMQIQMLSEIHHQLEAYTAYARTDGEATQREKLVHIYESSRRLIDEIIQGHVARRGEKAVRSMLHEAEKDNVYQALLEKLQRNFGYNSSQPLFR